MGKEYKVEIQQNPEYSRSAEREFLPEGFLSLDQIIDIREVDCIRELAEQFASAYLKFEQSLIAELIQLLSTDGGLEFLSKIRNMDLKFDDIAHQMGLNVKPSSVDSASTIVGNTLANMIRPSLRAVLSRGLKHPLFNGKIFAYVIGDDGIIWRVPSSMWGGRPGILALEQGRLDHPETSVSGRVLIHRSDLDALLNGREIQPRFDLPTPPSNINAGNYSGYALLAPPNSEPNSKSRPGARATYDIEAFLTEAARIVFYEGRPETQAELRRRTCAAYVRKGYKGGEPSDEWAKKKIRRFWKRLDLEGEL